MPRPDDNRPLFRRTHFVNLKGLKIKKPNTIVEEIVTESAAVQKGLTDYWRPVYSAKTLGSTQLQKLLGMFSRKVGPSLTFDSISFPEVEEYGSNIGAQKHSSPGPDGVLFAAYKAIASTTAAALKNLADVLASPPPPLPSPLPLPLTLHALPAKNLLLSICLISTNRMSFLL